MFDRMYKFYKSHSVLCRYWTISLFLIWILWPGILTGQQSDSDHLRALLGSTPQLTVERIDLQFEPSIKLYGISSLAVDKQKNIYVIHRPPQGDPIVVFNPQGKFLRSWGAGLFKIPHTIRIDAQGFVWTIDANTSKVYKFTSKGEKLLEVSVGDVPDSQREFCGATDIAFGRNGNFYVTDGYCNARVVEFDAQSKKIREWGKRGSGPGEFNLPHASVIGPDDNLYVADRENGRVQWFRQDGTYLGERDYYGQLHSLTFTPAGELFAVLHPKDAVPEKESYIVRIDRKSGVLTGKYEIRSHELAASPDGTLLPASRDSQVVLLRVRGQ